MKVSTLVAIFVFSVIFSTSVAYAFIDSVIVQSPDYDLEITTKVTSPDDCYGEKDGGHWEWIDNECILVDSPPDYKIVPRKYLFAPPLKQIKAGVALTDIQCNKGKHVVYKYDRMRAACLTDKAEGELLKRGWAALRLGLPATDDIDRDLCGWYEGQWDASPRYCHGLKYPLLCAMAGGDVMDGSCFIPSTTRVAPIVPDYVLSCKNNGGKWIAEFNECELFESPELCTDIGGVYDECASACRNVLDYPNVVCTDNCVEVCSFR